jgi:hypothetical protein
MPGNSVEIRSIRVLINPIQNTASKQAERLRRSVVRLAEHRLKRHVR